MRSAAPSSAGKVARLDGRRAAVEAERARLAIERASLDLEQARSALATTWGADVAVFDRAKGDLGATTALPPLSELEPLLTRHPALSRWEDEIERLQAAILAEEARAAPGVAVALGAQRFRDVSEVAPMLEVSVGLPVFDRNQGAIAEARFRLAQARDRQRVVEIALRAELRHTTTAYQSASRAVKSLELQLLPAALEAQEGTLEAYQLGQVGLTALLDAQRTLLDVQGEHIETLAALEHLLANAERLVAQPMGGGAPSTDRYQENDNDR